MSNEQKIDLSKLRFPIVFLVLLWIIHIVKVIAGARAEYYFGLKPLSVPRITGILTGPLIHGDWGHLINNSLSFAGLSFFLFQFYPRIALRSFLMIYVMSGIGVWLFARNSFHIGASGLIFGMVALLFWLGIFRRNARSIGIALVVLVLYSGMFYGLMPSDERISFESHIAGALSGIFAAYYFKNDLEEEPQADLHKVEKKKYFLPRDIFEKTKYQRYLEQQSNQSPENPPS